MSRESTGLSPELQQYVDDHTTLPTAVQRQLLDVTAEMPAAGMQIAHEQAVFLSILVAGLQPGFAVEVGTFTGYSSLAIASALPDGGRLLCCDVSEKWTSIARQHWEAAGVADRIDLVIGPASETLAELPADRQVDFAFIDADKGGYIDYYEALLARLGPAGVIAVDNVLWHGAVLDPDDRSPDTVAIRAFNDHVAADDRSIQVIVPIGDGVMLVHRAG